MDEVELKWSFHDSTLIKGIKTSFTTQSFTDCTLKAGSGQIKAHRMILSACSPFFQSIFETNETTELIFDGLTFDELRILVEYIYNGEIRVEKQRLKRIMQLKSQFKLDMEKKTSIKEKLSDFLTQNKSQSLCSRSQPSIKDLTSKLFSRSISDMPVQTKISQSNESMTSNPGDHIQIDLTSKLMSKETSSSNISDSKSQNLKHTLESLSRAKFSSVQTKIEDLTAKLLSRSCSFEKESTNLKMNEAKFFSDIPSSSKVTQTTSSLISRNASSQLSGAVRISSITIPNLESDDELPHCEPIAEELHISEPDKISGASFNCSVTSNEKNHSQKLALTESNLDNSHNLKQSLKSFLSANSYSRVQTKIEDITAKLLSRSCSFESTNTMNEAFFSDSDGSKETQKTISRNDPSQSSGAVSSITIPNLESDDEHCEPIPEDSEPDIKPSNCRLNCSISHDIKSQDAQNLAQTKSDNEAVNTNGENKGNFFL